ncbi:MAG: hypothetical protein WBB45_11575 [Cyclobacteriaceae bacterium]
MNDRILASAGERDQLKQKWQKALESGSTLIEEIKVPFPENKDYSKVKSLHYNRTIRNLLYMLASGIFSFGIEAFNLLGRAFRHIRSKEDIIFSLMLIGGLGVIVFGGLAYRAFKTYVKYRDISKDIHQIGEALVESLINVGAIQTDASNLEVKARVDMSGAIYCYLKGGTTYEKSTFIKSLQEIIGPVDNPRYIMIRKGFFLNVFSQKDYHSVPDLIGRKKQFAEHFEKQWRKLVGSCELVYTRTIEGRKILLRSRIHSLASEFEDRTERINKWRK